MAVSRVVLKDVKTAVLRVEKWVGLKVDWMAAMRDKKTAVKMVAY